jgi:peptidyl-prolyl cis-trans isomerase SurA
MVSPRQVFYRFASKLNPQAPTEEQRATIEKARKLSVGAKDCAAMEAAAHAAGNEKDGNPGELRLDAIAVPALRQLMATLPIGKASEPLIADDGVAVVMVCAREARTLELPDKRAIAESLLAERAELVSRQLLRDLQRKARIERRL